MSGLGLVEIGARPATHQGARATRFVRGHRRHRRTARLMRRLALVDPDVRRLHARLRKGLVAFVAGGDLPTFLTIPVVYSLLVALALLDAWVTVFQSICFRAWGLPRVRRRDYFAIDRHKLAYLNAIEKANCLYCSYANGLFAYGREVASRTEQYWCPIKHARRVRAPHERYGAFTDYGDAGAYRRDLPALRRALVRPPFGAPRRGRRTNR